MIIYTQADKLSKVTVTAILVSEQNTFNRRAKSRSRQSKIVKSVLISSYPSGTNVNSTTEWIHTSNLSSLISTKFGGLLFL